MSVKTAREQVASEGSRLFPPLRRFHLTVTLERSTTLPSHTGSLLRGALGHALLDLACDCGQSTHTQTCRYRQLFAPSATLPGLATPPPPLLITPPDWQAVTRPTRRFDMQVSLMGPACQSAPLVMTALQRALHRGLGEQRVAGRVTDFQTESSLPLCSSNAVRIRLTTPMLIKHQQNQNGNDTMLRASEVRGRDWLIALHRRLSLLDQLYGLDLPALAEDTLRHACDHLGSQLDLRDINVARRSNRQHKTMSFPALIGELCLYNLPDVLQPWLTLGQWLHVGSKAALGFGAYSLDEISTHE